MRHCTNHCSACGSHFTSTGAFDSHRSGPHDGERVCWSPDNKRAEKLQLATKDGLCAIYEPPSFPVAIYEDAQAVAAARAYFSGEGRERANTSLREAA